MKVPVHVRSREGAIQAFCPELPGCSATARTEAEALRLLRDRIASHFADGARSALPGTRIVHVEV